MLITKRNFLTVAIFFSPFIFSIIESTQPQKKTGKETCACSQNKSGGKPAAAKKTIAKAPTKDDLVKIFEPSLLDYYKKRFLPNKTTVVGEKPYIIGYIEIKDYKDKPEASHRFPNPVTFQENRTADIINFAKINGFSLPDAPKTNTLYGVLYSNKKINWYNRDVASKKEKKSSNKQNSEELDDNDLYKHGASAVAGSAAGW